VHRIVAAKAPSIGQLASAHHEIGVDFDRRSASPETFELPLRLSVLHWCQALVAAHRRQGGAQLDVRDAGSGQDRYLRTELEHVCRAGFSDD